MERRIKFFATDISTKKRKRTVVIELFFQVDFSFNFETEKKKDCVNENNTNIY